MAFYHKIIESVAGSTRRFRIVVVKIHLTSRKSKRNVLLPVISPWSPPVTIVSGLYPLFRFWQIRRGKKWIEKSGAKKHSMTGCEIDRMCTGRRTEIVYFAYSPRRGFKIMSYADIFHLNRVARREKIALRTYFSFVCFFFLLHVSNDHIICYKLLMRLLERKVGDIIIICFKPTAGWRRRSACVILLAHLSLGEKKVTIYYGWKPRY